MSVKTIKLKNTTNVAKAKVITPVEPPKEKKKFIIEGVPDANLEKLLKHLNKFDICINTVSNVLEWANKGESDFEELNENDLLLALRKAGMKGIKNDLITYIGSSEVKDYDPFQNYFENLPTWNGETDHIKKLASYIKTDDQDFFNEMFKKHLIRCIACSLDKHVFNKQCFTMIANQDDGKSTFVRYLVPSKMYHYYKDGINFDGKDADIAVTENFIINLDEVDSSTLALCGTLYVSS